MEKKKKCPPSAIIYLRLYPFFFLLKTQGTANEQENKKREKNVYLLNCLLLKNRDGIVSKSSVAENEQRFPPLQKFSLLQRFYFSSIQTTIGQNRIQKIIKMNEKLGENGGKMPTFNYTLFFSYKPLKRQLNRKQKKGENVYLMNRLLLKSRGQIVINRLLQGTNGGFHRCRGFNCCRGIFFSSV